MKMNFLANIITHLHLLGGDIDLQIARVELGDLCGGFPYQHHLGGQVLAQLCLQRSGCCFAKHVCFLVDSANTTHIVKCCLPSKLGNQWLGIMLQSSLGVIHIRSRLQLGVGCKVAL
jgi:hypothetical protein